MKKAKKEKERKRERRKGKKEKRKKEGIKNIEKFFIIFLVIFTLLIVLSGIFSIFNLKEKRGKEEKIIFKKIPRLSNASYVEMYLPAVDSEGKGVLTLLVVEAIPGHGRTLVDIDNLLFWADTQHSIRIARDVASNLTTKNISNYDIIYSIYANASIIGGESAGAAITLATIAAIENKTLRKDVIITGTINHDGTIGPVSAIKAKAEAAKEIASLFLVPLGQSRDVIFEKRRYCKKFGVAEICHEEIIPKEIDVSREVGIEIKEVKTIVKAMEYFFQNSSKIEFSE